MDQFETRRFPSDRGYDRQAAFSQNPGAPVSNDHNSDGDADKSCPLDGSSDKLGFDTYKNKAEKRCRDAGISDLEDKNQEGIFDNVQTCFQNFSDSLSALGRDGKSPGSTSIVAGMATAIANANLFTMLVPTLNTVCSKFASVFNSTTDEIARTIFSGLCIVSTGIRAALPIVAEMARRATNQEEVFIFSIVSVVMASVYLATSSISVLLASHSAILDTPTTAKMASKLKDEIESVEKERTSKNFSEFAAQNLQKIEGMLTDWKTTFSANLLSFGREFLLFSGAVLSAFSAISKFVPSLAIPFVSIITGSISLFANVFEVGQGIVEYRNQKAKLKSLKKELAEEKDSSKKAELEKQIKRLENQLKLSVVRIAKGVLNILVSLASIVVGILMTASLLNPPVFFLVSAIFTAISLTSVLVLGAGGLVVRKMNNSDSTGNAPSAVGIVESADEPLTDETKETASESEFSEDEDCDRNHLNQQFDDSGNRNSTSGHQNGGASGRKSQWEGGVTLYV